MKGPLAAVLWVGIPGLLLMSQIDRLGRPALGEARPVLDRAFRLGLALLRGSLAAGLTYAASAQTLTRNRSAIWVCFDSTEIDFPEIMLAETSVYQKMKAPTPLHEIPCGRWLLLVALGLSSGCGGFTATKSVSPLDFILPGLVGESGSPRSVPALAQESLVCAGESGLSSAVP